MIHFDLPKEKSSIIKVIGVGGGGSNAVNHMYAQDIEGVNFIICNTDAQALAQSNVPNKIQLGPHLTQGLGAGANPEIGKQATEESLEEIKRILEVNTKMAFITAGMGGGTGTGGAPILSKICKELGILTVGIVTTPFAYEGKKRQVQAQEGINRMKEYVDTLLVISNDKLRHQFGNLTMKAAFTKADNVLATAAKCITDVINSTGQINVDFADVCTVMRNGGVAILGSANASGENRAFRAIEEALNSPLLNDNDIRGARWILININSAEGDHEFTMDEVDIIQSYLLERAGEETDVILGLGYDSSLGDEIGITLIATGFEYKDPFKKSEAPREMPKAEEKKTYTLSMNGAPEAKSGTQVSGATSNGASAGVNYGSGAAGMMGNGNGANNGSHANNGNTAGNSNHAASTGNLNNGSAEDDALLGMKLEVRNMNQSALPFEEMQQGNEDPMAPKLVREEDRTTTSENYGGTNVENNPVQSGSGLVNYGPQTMNTQVPAPQAGVPQHTKEAVVATSTSGGSLAKPSNIYMETRPEQFQSVPVEKLPEPPSDNDDSSLELQLVVRENGPGAADLSDNDSLTIGHHPHAQKPFVEEPAMQDEAEEQRRRAAERIQKLRNLSFNINSGDPNSEFDSVPAYVRRNMELYNQPNPLSNVENFYSGYTVNSNDNNQADISTINTFLDGRKPD